MRLVPLTIFCKNLTIDEIEKAVSLEVNITHPNETTQKACVSWAIALTHLYNNPNDTQGAY
jgi:ADP-ribosylglycohydrolase